MGTKPRSELKKILAKYHFLVKPLGYGYAQGLFIEPRDRELEDRGKRDPREVGEVGVGDPGDDGVNNPQRPDERDPHKDDIDAREDKVAHPKEDGCKNDIKKEVEHKRQQDE